MIVPWGARALRLDLHLTCGTARAVAEAAGELLVAVVAADDHRFEGAFCMSVSLTLSCMSVSLTLS